jgi:hypothetical protein
MDRLGHTCCHVLDIHFPWEEVYVGFLVQRGENFDRFDGSHSWGGRGVLFVESLLDEFRLTLLGVTNLSRLDTMVDKTRVLV